MIKSITLQNFRSFGARQEVPLGPITLLVGPNNSGKSAFASVGQLLANAARLRFYGSKAIKAKGGIQAVVHRPVVGDDPRLVIEVKSTFGTYETQLDVSSDGLTSVSEKLVHGRNVKSPEDGNKNVPFGLLYSIFRQDKRPREWEVVAPLVDSRLIRLSRVSLRRDSPPLEKPSLAEDGGGLAQVINYWRSTHPEKAEALDAFVHSCLPEVRQVLAKPAPVMLPGGMPNVPGTQRVLVRQADGECFDATQISDGVLFLIGLAVHAVDAPEGGLLFVEEPEQCIHPARIHEVVDLYRSVVSKKKCQVIISTHSRVLVDEFRDEPERVCVFRRSQTGTQVRPLNALPNLKEALYNYDPGELLEAGLFDVAFAALERAVDL